MENTNEINHVQEWINNDPKLSAILVEIQELPISIEEQAEIAFHRISETYNVPKLPDDINYDDEDYEKETVSVYQYLGVIKYLNPEIDSRGNVLLAIYLAKEHLEIDYNLVFLEAQKNGINENEISGIGYVGENSNVNIIFIRNNESWSEKGCNLFIKLG